MSETMETVAAFVFDATFALALGAALMRLGAVL